MSKGTKIKKPMRREKRRKVQIRICKVKCKTAAATFRSIFWMYKTCCLVRELQRSCSCSHSMDCDKSQGTVQCSECLKNNFLCSNSKSGNPLERWQCCFNHVCHFYNRTGIDVKSIRQHKSRIICYSRFSLLNRLQCTSAMPGSLFYSLHDNCLLKEKNRVDI